MFHEHGNLLFVQNAAVVLVNTLEPLPGDADVRGAVVDSLWQALEAGKDGAGVSGGTPHV